jgi:hypothetical protein
LSDALRRFERYLRARQAPAEPPMKGAEVYRRLLRANLQTVIDNAFPVARRILSAQDFGDLFAAFLEERGPSTPYYRDVPGDLVAYAESVEHPYADLLDYEWVELVARRHPARVEQLRPGTDGLLRANPTLQIRIYSRPVHEMSEALPRPEPFDVPMAYLIWRRPDEEVVFHRAGLIIARAVELLLEAPAELTSLCRHLAGETGLGERDLDRALREAFREIALRDGIFGTL